MFIEVKAKSNVTEQDKLKTYWIDLEFSLWKDYNLDFSWYLARPKVQWQRAMLDSLNEFIRNNCFDIVEENPIYHIKEKEIETDWETKTVESRVVITWNHLYNTCMQVIMKSLDEMNERWDALFMLKVDDNKMRRLKKKREDAVEEIEKLKDEIRDLDLELTKQKTIKEVKQQLYAQAINDWYVQPQQSPQAQQAQSAPLPHQVQNTAPVQVQQTTKQKLKKSKDEWYVMDDTALKNLW